MLETPDIAFFKERYNYVEPNTDGSEIVRFYKGKNVLITGGTGFIGKLLIEKLLRVCKDIECIYIICRDKKGQNFHSRIDDIFNDVVFERLSQAHPKFRHKIVAIKGDITLPGLGISPEDRKQLIERVNVIYHVAATVRFDEKLRNAIKANVLSTLDLLEMAKECRHFDSFVHVSSAYANSQEQELHEKFYDIQDRFEECMHLMKTKSDDDFDAMEAEILHPWPNTYTFSKALAENVCMRYEHILPICIYRPAIVVSTYKEPVRAWIDNLYGPTGVIAGAGLGILKCLYCDADNPSEIVPGDMVVNGMIGASHETYKRTSKANIKFYNYVSSENPFTWNEFCTLNCKYGVHVPSTKAIWYLNFRMTKNRFLYLVYTIFMQYLPAALADGVCWAMGKEPKLWKAYQKISRFSKVITYFSIRRWHFKNQNTQELWRHLNKVDQRVFPFDMKSVDWEYHSQMNSMGIRTYLIKEDPSTLPEGKKKWIKFRILDTILRFAFYFILIRISYSLLMFVFNVIV